MAAENRGRSPAPAPTATEDNEDVPAPSYSWTLPSDSISPPARAASPSTASSASSTSDSAASSLALFIKTQVTRLRENPRPILASRLSNLRPMRPEGRISRWMLDVEAQQEIARGSRRSLGDGESRSLLGGNGSAGDRDYATLYKVADSLRGSHSAQYGRLIRGGQIRENEIYQKDAQPSEDECDLENGCAYGCWWQWVVLTIVVLSLIAWGLWVLLGDRDAVGSKRLL
ncbi:hypothetical protein Slin14017_G069270 [Septoria linicola]|nr:hypothetical protein Slin14017_G069270 [Septoria linicola]